MKNTIFYFLLPLFIFSCKTSKTNTANDLKAIIEDSTQVSFISFGSGINYKAKLKLDSILALRNTGCNYSYALKPWGREGEVDYIIKGEKSCIVKLNEIVTAKFKALENVKIKK